MAEFLKWTKVQPSSEDLLPYSVKGVKIKIGPLDNRLSEDSKRANVMI